MRINPTRFVRLVFIFCLTAAWSFQSASSRAEDPADVYLTGYMMVRAAEEFYEARDYQKAYQKYVEAAKFFKAIAERWKDFEPSMVDYRRKKINEAIAEIERMPGFNPVKGYGNRPRANTTGSPRIGAPSRTGVGRESAVDQLLRQKDEQIRDLTAERTELGAKLALKDRERRHALEGKGVAERKAAALMNQIGHGQLQEEPNKSTQRGQRRDRRAERQGRQP